jgi:hypothetical protein
MTAESMGFYMASACWPACLPGMSEQPSAQTGTVMRPETLKKYALAAGFSEMEILSIEHFFFRLYRLF